RPAPGAGWFAPPPRSSGWEPAWHARCWRSTPPPRPPRRPRPRHRPPRRRPLQPPPPAAKADAVELDSNSFGGLQARAIGPAATGGRIATIDAVADEPLTVYVGSAGGGAWRARDR